MNRLLFEEVPDSYKLQTPKKVVGASEHTQMEARIDGFVTDARVSLAGRCQ